ncbi:MAG: hypothetical protein KDK51_01415 [Deltaproteobacteria bacterium]|nr:hypothetical protein [Deltaproteobacteria bacterium]
MTLTQSIYMRCFTVLMAITLTACQSNRANVTASRGSNPGLKATNAQQLLDANPNNSSNNTSSSSNNNTQQNSSAKRGGTVNGNAGGTNLQSDDAYLAQLDQDEKEYQRLVSVLAGSYYVTTLPDEQLEKLAHLLAADDIDIIKAEHGKLDQAMGKALNVSILEQLQHVATQDFSDPEAKKKHLKELIDSYKVLEAGLENANQPFGNTWYVDAYMLYTALGDVVAQMSQETVSSEDIKAIVDPLALGRDIQTISGQASEIQIITGNAGDGSGGGDNDDLTRNNQMSEFFNLLYCTMQHEFESVHPDQITVDLAACRSQSHTLDVFNTLIQRHTNEACANTETIALVKKYVLEINKISHAGDRLTNAEMVLLKDYAEKVVSATCIAGQDPAPLDPDRITDAFKVIHCSIKKAFDEGKNLGSYDDTDCASGNITHAMFETMTNQHADSDTCSHPNALSSIKGYVDLLLLPDVDNSPVLTVKEKTLLRNYANRIKALACYDEMVSKGGSNDDIHPDSNTHSFGEVTDPEAAISQIDLLVNKIDGTAIPEDNKNTSLHSFVKTILTRNSVDYAPAQTLGASETIIQSKQTELMQLRNVQNIGRSIMPAIVVPQNDKEQVQLGFLLNALNGSDPKKLPDRETKLSTRLKGNKGFGQQKKSDGSKIKTMGDAYDWIHEQGDNIDRSVSDFIVEQALEGQFKLLQRASVRGDVNLALPVARGPLHPSIKAVFESQQQNLGISTIPNTVGKAVDLIQGPKQRANQIQEELTQLRQQLLLAKTHAQAEQERIAQEESDSQAQAREQARQRIQNNLTVINDSQEKRKQALSNGDNNEANAQTKKIKENESQALEDIKKLREYHQQQGNNDEVAQLDALEKTIKEAASIPDAENNDGGFDIAAYQALQREMSILQTLIGHGVDFLSTTPSEVATIQDERDLGTDIHTIYSTRMGAEAAKDIKNVQVAVSEMSQLAIVADESSSVSNTDVQAGTVRVGSDDMSVADPQALLSQVIVMQNYLLANQSLTEEQAGLPVDPAISHAIVQAYARTTDGQGIDNDLADMIRTNLVTLNDVVLLVDQDRQTNGPDNNLDLENVGNENMQFEAVVSDEENALRRILTGVRQSIEAMQTTDASGTSHVNNGRKTLQDIVDDLQGLLRQKQEEMVKLQQQMSSGDLAQELHNRIDAIIEGVLPTRNILGLSPGQSRNALRTIMQQYVDQINPHVRFEERAYSVQGTSYEMMQFIFPAIPVDKLSIIRNRYLSLSGDVVGSFGPDFVAAIDQTGLKYFVENVGTIFRNAIVQNIIPDVTLPSLLFMEPGITSSSREYNAQVYNFQNITRLSVGHIHVNGTDAPPQQSGLLFFLAGTSQ